MRGRVASLSGITAVAARRFVLLPMTLYESSSWRLGLGLGALEAPRIFLFPQGKRLAKCALLLGSQHAPCALL